MNEILSLWRLPLDKVALLEAQKLAERQPRCQECQIEYGTPFDAMTIFNYGEYVEGAGGDYSTALTNMFGKMNPNSYGNYGGLAFIPQLSYTVTPPSATGFSVPDQCVMVGSGGGGSVGGSSGTDFFHFIVSEYGPPLVPTVFLFCSGPHTSGGIHFRGLAFQWVGASHPTDTCIVAHDMWNCRAINCTFTDCPTVLDTSLNTWPGTKRGEACTLEQCTIDYTQGPAGTTAVILAGPQCAIVGPSEFTQTSQSSGGPTGCTCIAVQGPSEHAVIAEARIYNWTFGVDFSQMQGSEYTSITNCEVLCWQTALNIVVTAGAGGVTAGIKALGCTLAKTSDSSDHVNPVAVIDATDNGNGALNDVTLLDCTVFHMASLPPLPSGPHGLVIGSGSNIKIIGGTYSNNGPYGGAGIAIVGSCTDVLIIGANLQPSYPGAPNTNNQQYALLVSANPSGPVLVTNCDMSGYALGPVNVTVTLSENTLTITNCPGYNDRNAPLNNSLMPTTPVGAATCLTPYFGPSLFTWSNPSGPVSVSVFGLTYTASYGVIFLPSPYDIISFTSQTLPAHFSWIGK
jgi:hypothetical protein